MANRGRLLGGGDPGGRGGGSVAGTAVTADFQAGGRGGLTMGEMLGPYELNTIVTGDARELAKAIPDESVDLIFTDPVYDRIEDYAWLAETAARVLKPGGALLCWSNGKWHYLNSRWLEDFGLIYRYTFTNHLIRAVAPMNGKIVSKCNRVLWFDVHNTSDLVDYVSDGYPTGIDRSLGNHTWAKDPRYTNYLLEGFTHIGDTVFDPFVGGGTTAAVAKMLSRRYLAFEIDPATAEAARKRVEMTQPPLPGMNIEQSSFLMEAS